MRNQMMHANEQKMLAFVIAWIASHGMTDVTKIIKLSFRV
jgi:hypothetical protein